MSKIDIVEVLADPCVRYWVKSSINTLLEKDPVKAYQDAALVAEIFKQRLDEIMEKSSKEMINGAKQDAPKGWECAG